MSGLRHQHHVGKRYHHSGKTAHLLTVKLLLQRRVPVTYCHHDAFVLHPSVGLTQLCVLPLQSSGHLYATA